MDLLVVDTRALDVTLELVRPSLEHAFACFDLDALATTDGEDPDHPATGKISPPPSAEPAVEDRRATGECAIGAAQAPWKAS
jgi:hypothetical protein